MYLNSLHRHQLMKHIYFYLFFISILSVIISCQKEIDGELPERTTSDSTDLASIIALDTTQVSGQDTFYKIVYSYDAQKRKALEVFTEYDNPTMTADVWIYRYFYHNNDTLPYKVTERYQGSADSISFYLTYSNGFVIKDSTMNHSFPYSFVAYFSELPGGRYLKKVVNYDLVNNITTVQDSTIYTRSIVNGNRVSGLDSTWITPVGPPLLMDAVSTQFAFDNKPNPFERITIRYLGNYDNFEAETYVYTSYSYGKNNLISVQSTRQHPPGPPEGGTYSYTYLDNGYPSVMRLNGDWNKVLFFYTRL